VGGGVFVGGGGGGFGGGGVGGGGGGGGGWGGGGGVFLWGVSRGGGGGGWGFLLWLGAWGAFGVFWFFGVWGVFFNLGRVLVGGLVGLLFCCLGGGWWGGVLGCCLSWEILLVYPFCGRSALINARVQGGGIKTAQKKILGEYSFVLSEGKGVSLHEKVRRPLIDLYSKLGLGVLRVGGSETKWFGREGGPQPKRGRKLVKAFGGSHFYWPIGVRNDKKRKTNQRILHLEQVGRGDRHSEGARTMVGVKVRECAGKG